jgi:hypothetical protein
MQAAAQLTIPNSPVSPRKSSAVTRLDSLSVTGRIGSLMARMFGCRHAELSRPFSRDGRAYRSCVNCGAQRQFHLGNWEMQGHFYYRQPQRHQIHAV